MGMKRAQRITTRVLLCCLTMPSLAIKMRASPRIGSRLRVKAQQRCWSCGSARANRCSFMLCRQKGRSVSNSHHFDEASGFSSRVLFIRSDCALLALIFSRQTLVTPREVHTERLSSWKEKEANEVVADTLRAPSHCFLGLISQFVQRRKLFVQPKHL